MYKEPHQKIRVDIVNIVQYLDMDEEILTTFRTNAANPAEAEGNGKIP